MRIILSSITVWICFCSFGQILDDSTELVYGPRTTKWTTEYNVLNNIEQYHEVDTAIYLFERQSFVDRHERKFQDLGSFGTALFPVFHESQSTIGRTSGYNAYSRFAYQQDAIKYYDTKSPYIDLLAYLGGENRNIVDVRFSRNVNENWNIGLETRRITTDKQLAGEGETDRLVVGNTFLAYTHYKHGKLPYQLLANYSSMTHGVVEQGGTRFTSDSLQSDYFLFDNVLLRLEDAEAEVKQSNLHLYHDLQIADQFQLYHSVTRYNEENTYKDFAESSISSNNYDTYEDYYPVSNVDEDSTYERSTFSSFENEAGIKGDLASIFYRGYVKLRKVAYSQYRLGLVDELTEKYVGGFVRFSWREKFAVLGEGEYLLAGGYKLKGDLSSELINVSYSTRRFDVPYLYSRYFGNHYEWSNSFDPVSSNELKGQLNLAYKAIELKPEVRFNAFQNMLYFDSERMPQQAGRGVLLSSLGGHANVRLKNQKGEGYHFENYVLLTNVSGGSANVVRVPPVFYNGRVFWRGHWFKDKVPIELGADLHARSAYFANAYAPETQQFYLQDDQDIFGYFTSDVFVNMRLDKFFLGFKWVYFNQPADSGYFSTPYYPGQPRTVDLIVRWMFFD